MNRRHLLSGLATATAGLALARPLRALPGVSQDRILLGQVAAFEGPASALGLGMRDGLTAALAEANAAGGVRGRKLELVTANDGYEPKLSAEATQAMIDQGVFALVGPVGTPTSLAAHPVAAAAGVPFIGPFTGAQALREPYLPHVVNIRASYFQETEMMVERLTADRGFTKIAIFFQDDTFGRAGLAGTERAMKKRNMALAAQGTFERNTVAVKAALLAIRKAEPQAVIMIGPYKPCAEFIKSARTLRFEPTFINISFVGSEALAKELGPAGVGVLVTQVVPLPFDASVPVVAAYQKALAAALPAASPGFVSLEGYLVGRSVVAALGRVEGEPTRDALLAAYRSQPIDLGGFEMRFAPDDNQGSDFVAMTKIDDAGGFASLRNLA